MPGPPWLRQRLTNAGFRLTWPRQVILDVLGQNPQHLSAEEIFFHVHQFYPGIGMATVYRTLDLLTRTGLVFKFDFGDGRSRYELASEAAKGPHHHMICTGCGRIIDFGHSIDEEGELIAALGKELSEKHGFKINSHRIHFYGLCQDCQSSSTEGKR